MSTFPSYYDVDGNPIDANRFAELKWEPAGPITAYSRIGRDTINTPDDGMVEVSTVWLGLDHQFGEGPPLIFETLIFGGDRDGEVRRYSTKEEALAGHLHAVNEIQQGRAPW